MDKEITTTEVTDQVKAFLEHVNYIIEEPEIPKEFMGKPDFYGKREQDKTYEICGLTKQGLKDIPRAITHLWTLKRQLGHEVNYVIALPLVSEKDLAALLAADKNKLLKKVKRDNFVIWLCDPEAKSIVSVHGTPQDDIFSKHIQSKELSF